MNRLFVIFTSITLSAATMVVAEPTTAAIGTGSAAPAPVERATADAVARLYAQITNERIDGTPVSDIVERVGGREMILDGLSRAEQIGGPREVADGVVQVNLEISGERAAALVVQAVSLAPAKTPIPARRLAASLAFWKDRSFSSTGDNVEVDSREVDVVHRSGSAGPSSAVVAQTQASRLVLPDVPPAWTRDAQTVSVVSASAGSSLRTARTAEKAARAALREQLGKLTLDEHMTLSSTGRQAESAIDVAVAAAKISAIDYRADGSVKVDVSIDGQQLWQTLQISAAR